MATRFPHAPPILLVLCTLCLLGGPPAAHAQGTTPQMVSFSITFPTESLTLSGFEFNATATSGLGVSVTTNTTGVCTHVSLLPFGRRLLLLIRPGTCVVTATQAGNTEFAPASTSATIQVAKRQLEVTFHGVPSIPVPYGDTFAVAAGTGNLGYVPAMAASGACSISGSGPGSIVTMRASAGDCLLTATHPGNESADVIPKTVVVPATLRPIAVAADVQLKFQGAPDPALTYRVVGGSLVAGDGFTGGPARNAGEAPGFYNIYTANLHAGSHYALTFLGAPFVIVPLELTGPPQPVAFGTAVTETLRFHDLASPAAPTCLFDWDDPVLAAPTAGAAVKDGNDWTCSGSRAYSAPGVYLVQAAISDPDTGAALRTDEVVVYDPSSSVRGGGWFETPPGGFTANPALAGRIAFDIDSSYRAGGIVPTGRLELRAGDSWFLGTVHEWLVADGTRARLRGFGVTHTGAVHGFEVTASEGRGATPARLRLMLWSRSGTIVYDSQPGAPAGAEPMTPLGGGAITVGG